MISLIAAKFGKPEHKIELDGGITIQPQTHTLFSLETGIAVSYNTAEVVIPGSFAGGPPGQEYFTYSDATDIDANQVDSCDFLDAIGELHKDGMLLYVEIIETTEERIEELVKNADGDIIDFAKYAE